MPMSKDDKLNFVFKVALEMAEKEKLVPIGEFWMAKYDISEDDIRRSIKNISTAVNKLSGQKMDYSFLEMKIKDGKRFNTEKAQAIMGILYSRGEFVDLIEEMDFIPSELARFIQDCQKFYKPIKPLEQSDEELT